MKNKECKGEGYMVISEAFKSIIDEDIEKCDHEIQLGNKESRWTLHCRLVSKYDKIIDGFKDDLRSVFYDNEGTICICNLETMKQKLILFKAMGYENGYSKSANDNGVTIHNTNKVETKINITFSEAKRKVEDMTSLKEAEIQEILDKIDELEKIIKSPERKSKKWECAKGIIKWIADKGVDVGITLLPLLLQIG